MKLIIPLLNQTISRRSLKIIIMKAILTAIAVIGIFGFMPIIYRLNFSPFGVLNGKEVRK
jgi:uncharacterized transporter YbjL